MPADIGLVYWMCLACPRTSFYVPFYYVPPQFPKAYSGLSTRPSADYYENRVSSPFDPDSMQAFWTFSNFRDKMDRADPHLRSQVRSAAEKLEKAALADQEAIETATLRMYRTKPRAAKWMSANYSRGIYLRALETMAGFISPVGQ